MMTTKTVILRLNIHFDFFRKFHLIELKNDGEVNASLIDLIKIMLLSARKISSVHKIIN